MRHKAEVAGYLFVLPAVLVLAVLLVYPIVSTFVMSLTDADGQFVGLSNYSAVIHNPTTSHSVKNTVLYVAGSAVLQILIGTGAGIALNERFRGRSFVRSMVLIPWVVPGVVAAATWGWMFHSDFGIVNQTLLSLGIIRERVVWLSNPKTVLPALVVVNVWKMFPFVAVMITAALQSIPQTLYEAARVDGASYRHEVRYIVLPSLRPVLVSITMLLIIWGLRGFTLIYVMTGGGPANRSLIVPLHIYVHAFQFFDFPRATALSVLLFLAVTGFVVVYIRFTSGTRER